jgi:aspartate racemase
MAKHIGIVACSAEGAALCYTTICTEAQREMGEFGHPEITMHTPPFAQYMKLIYASDWEAIGRLMLASARIVAQAGADFAISPDNTIHQGLDLVRDCSAIPWLHIAECVGEEAKGRGFKRLGVLGTKYLMTGPVYPRALEALSLAWEIPEERDRARIDDIIFKELVNGVFTEQSRLYFNEVIGKLRKRGCDAAVLGCTEIPLIVNPDGCPLPTLDSTRLLARAAIRRAIS